MRIERTVFRNDDAIMAYQMSSVCSGFVHHKLRESCGSTRASSRDEVVDRCCVRSVVGEFEIVSSIDSTLQGI